MTTTLGITMGDPLGVGPEIILKSLPKFRSQVQFKVFGDSLLLKGISASELCAVLTSPLPDPLPPGEREASLQRLAGQASVAYLDAALAAWKNGEIQGLVTAPISKTHVKLAGFPFPGHTEYLAAQTESQEFVMMLASRNLKVSLVTIHEALAQVSANLNQDNITNTIRITYEALEKKFGIKHPKLGVCGLNPHAGEGGMLGREEIEVIAPAIEQARNLGCLAEGPLVPDAAFHEALSGKWDALVCMYHDQGLIPFKMLHFWDGVNVTLGLPLIRTSPDHGTAFDIAGKGVAKSDSMEAAIAMAISMI